MKKLVLIIVCAISVFELAAQKISPNIVVIISDDHAYQAISAYGKNSLMQTPSIDRLAKEGALFTQAYVNNSLCGPSRAAFLSGKFSHANGFKDNVVSNFDFNQDIFVKRLQKIGYQTAWVGKMHLGDSIPQGFDYYNILPGQGQYYNPDLIETGNVRKNYTGYVSDVITNISEEWLNRRDRSKPFCLIIGHKATHRNWMPDIHDLGKFDHINFKLPNNFYDDYSTREAAKIQDMTVAKTMRMGPDLKMFATKEEAERGLAIRRMRPEQRKAWDDYYNKIYADFKLKDLKGNALTEWKFQRYLKDYLATAASLDRNIGHVLNYLDENDLTKNTIVIYMSDQGFYMGEHGWFDKRFMYEESFRTPMVMRYPGVIKPGINISNMFMNIDIAPTLLQVAGASIPSAMHGRSFLPKLQNKKYQELDAMYYHYYENGEHAVSPHFGVKTKRYKLIRFYEKVESWELFDLQADPQEMKNIYGTKGQEKVTAQLKSQLLKLLNKYGDAEAKRIFDTPIQ